jgi:hypothetical protein
MILSGGGKGDDYWKYMVSPYASYGFVGLLLIEYEACLLISLQFVGQSIGFGAMM